MIIVINAVATGISGTLSVAISFVEKVVPLFPQYKFYFITTLDGIKEDFSHIKNLTVVKLPRVLLNYFVRPYLDNFFLKKFFKYRLKANFIVNFDNLPVKTDLLQVHLMGNSYMSIKCKDIPIFKKRVFDGIISCLRRFFFYKRIKFVDLFVFQTRVMAKYVELFSGKNLNYKVIPNFHQEIQLIEEDGSLSVYKDLSYKYLLFVAYYYPHKNFEIFHKLARLIKENQLKVKFLVTFSGSRAEKIYKKIESDDLSDVVINIGDLTRKQINSYYKVADAIFFPSFLESFSRILSDAVQYNKPLIVADAKYSRELFNDDEVYFFDPYDVNSAYEAIIRYLTHKKSIVYKRGNKILSNEEIINYWELLLSDVINNLN